MFFSYRNKLKFDILKSIYLIIIYIIIIIHIIQVLKHINDNNLISLLN